MNKKIKYMLLPATAIALLSSCKMSNQAQKSENYTQAQEIETLSLSEEQRNFIQRNNDFALNLFRQTSRFDSKVISPLSVSFLMGILANAADGITYQEILKTLGAGEFSAGDINQISQFIIEKAGSLDPATKLNIANYIAVNKAFKLKDSFIKTVEHSYNAKTESLDFSSPQTLKRINSWCKKQTDNMIPKIIDNVEPNAVSYLMNAIYFNGSWSDKFNKKETHEENFRGYTRNIQRVEMMHRNDKYRYFSNDAYAAVDLPYGNGTYTMTVILPNTDKSTEDILKEINAKTLTNLSNNMENCIVDLKLPRFSTETDFPLNDIITKLGAPSMFSAGNANFKKFSDGNFFISKMFQKAKIEVSEEGTKAAAVTAAVMVSMSLQPVEPRRVEFHANRPFIYFIRESNSGAIFFMGQYCGNES